MITRFSRLVGYLQGHDGDAVDVDEDRVLIGSVVWSRAIKVLGHSDRGVACSAMKKNAKKRNAIDDICQAVSPVQMQPDDLYVSRHVKGTTRRVEISTIEVDFQHIANALLHSLQNTNCKISLTHARGERGGGIQRRICPSHPPSLQEEMAKRKRGGRRGNMAKADIDQRPHTQ